MSEAFLLLGLNNEMANQGQNVMVYAAFLLVGQVQSAVPLGSSYAKA
jgi:hypothetical protein